MGQVSRPAAGVHAGLRASGYAGLRAGSGDPAQTWTSAPHERGVTLIEALIVVALIAMIAAVSFPAIAAGLDTLRLRSASDSIVSFLNIALDHADRRQQAVEVVVSPRENILLSRTADLGFTRNLDMPAQIQIVSVRPALPIATDPAAPRHFLLYPGGSVPGIGIEISTLRGRKRLVSVDPISGSPRSEVVQ